MNFIKYLCCVRKNNEMKKCDRKTIKSNSVHFHELNSKSVENIKRFTIVKDINEKVIIKPYPFVYLGYPFVESDTES